MFTSSSAQEPAGDASGDLAARFRDQAVAQLSFGRARSEPLPPTAKRALLDFIDAGVLKLDEEGATPDRIELAEANLRAFMARVFAVSHTAPGRRIDKAAIQTVRSEMCPLYPFC